MRIMRMPAILLVYLSAPLYFLKKLSRDAVKIPVRRNGSAKPSVYTPTSTDPIALLFAEAAMSSTADSVGPTHGVHAKLNTNPMIRAVSGETAILSNRTGSLLSFISAEDVPRIPVWYSPNRITMIPPILANRIRFPLKNLPTALMPSPSRKNENPIPITKNKVFSKTFFLSKTRSPPWSDAEAPPDRYPI